MVFNFKINKKPKREKLFIDMNKPIKIDMINFKKKKILKLIFLHSVLLNF